MLWHATGNVLHHLPAPERSHGMLTRLRTRIVPPKPRPMIARPVQPAWCDPIIPVEREPFIDVCSAMRIWNNQWMGHWTTFDLKKLARKLGKKPWYRPLVSSLDP